MTETYNVKNYTAFFINMLCSLIPALGIVFIIFVACSDPDTALTKYGLVMLIVLLGSVAFLLPCINQMIFSVAGAYTISFDESHLTYSRTTRLSTRTKTIPWDRIQDIGMYLQKPNGSRFDPIAIQTEKRTFTFGQELSNAVKHKIASELKEKHGQL